MGSWRSWVKWAKSFVPGSSAERISRGPDLMNRLDIQMESVRRSWGKHWYEMQSLFSSGGTPRERCSIPFVITRDMKKQLKELGWKERHVKKLSPEQAHVIINKNLERPPDKKPDQPDHGTIILDDSTENTKTKQKE